MHHEAFMHKLWIRIRNKLFASVVAALLHAIDCAIVMQRGAGDTSATNAMLVCV